MKKKEAPAYVTAAELARRAGMKSQNVYKLIGEGVIPRRADKKVNLKKALEIIEGRRALDKNPPQQNGHLSPDDITDMQTARLEYERNRALLARLEYETKKKELIPVEDVLLFIQHVITTAKKSLLNIPSNLAPEIVGIDNPREARVILDKAIREALDELAKLGGIRSKIDSGL